MRDSFGRGGPAAALALLAYLLFLSGVLIGPEVPVLVLLAAAAGALAILYLRNPDRVHRVLPRPRRRRARPRPPGGPAAATVPAGAVVRRMETPSASLPVPETRGRRGLAAGSPLLRLLLARGWRTPAEMTRDFVLLGLAGVVLLLGGIALPDWPLLSWLGKVMGILGILCMLVSSGVVYSYFRDRTWRRPPTSSRR